MRVTAAVRIDIVRLFYWPLEGADLMNLIHVIDVKSYNVYVCDRVLLRGCEKHRCNAIILLRTTLCDVCNPNLFELGNLLRSSSKTCRRSKWVLAIR